MSNVIGKRLAEALDQLRIRAESPNPDASPPTRKCTSRRAERDESSTEPAGRRQSARAGVGAAGGDLGDVAGELEGRAVLEMGADDLYADREAIGAHADWHDGRREVGEPGRCDPCEQVEVRAVLAADVDAPAPLRLAVVVSRWPDVAGPAAGSRRNPRRTPPIVLGAAAAVLGRSTSRGGGPPNPA